MGDQAGPKILIIDRETAQAEALRRELTHAGFQAIVAFDAASGLKVAALEKPDAVIMDLTLPKQTGIDALKRLVASGALDGRPVLVLSNLNQEEDIREAREIGAAGYLIKSDTKITDIPRLVADLLRPKKAQAKL